VRRRRPLKLYVVRSVPGDAGIVAKLGNELVQSQFDWMRERVEEAAKMMKPYAGEVEAWEVDEAVGQVRNKRPELTGRVALL
jgi:hypothetical protein